MKEFTVILYMPQNYIVAFRTTAPSAMHATLTALAHNTSCKPENVLTVLEGWPKVVTPHDYESAYAVSIQCP